MAAGWLLNLGFAGGADATVTAVVNGSVSDGALESEIMAGWQDLVITLTGATWDTGQDFNDARQSIIDGLDSGGSETGGWNTEVRDKIEPIAVSRITDEIVSILLPSSPAYQIASNETITVTVPAGAQSDASAITATPTFAVTADTVTGTAIVNANSTTDITTNEEFCDRTNFRTLPGELQKEWTGQFIRPESWEIRHPQDMLRTRATDRFPGSRSPEQADTFLADGEVTADDL